MRSLPSHFNGYNDNFFQSNYLFARLKPGVTSQQAQAEVNVFYQQIVRAFPDAKLNAYNRGRLDRTHIPLTSLTNGRSYLRHSFSDPLKILMGVTALVLLIACANIANLLLARSTARAREFAVRQALGAHRLRLVRQLLTESLLLALAGGLLGILFAVAADRLLLRMISGGSDADLIPLNVSLNLRLLTEKRTRRSKLRLVPMLLLQPVQIVIGLALTIFFARFWIANLDSWPLVIGGVLLHALSIGLIIDAVVRTLLIVRINYAAPVVTIQRYLALLRRWEIRSFKWTWIGVWLAPPALLLVGARLSTSLDLWSVAPRAVIYTAIGSAIGVGLSYLFDLWARRSPRLGAAMNSMYVGYSIASAQASLDEIDEFARE